MKKLYWLFADMIDDTIEHRSATLDELMAMSTLYSDWIITDRQLNIITQSDKCSLEVKHLTERISSVGYSWDIRDLSTGEILNSSETARYIDLKSKYAWDSQYYPYYYISTEKHFQKFFNDVKNKQMTKESFIEKLTKSINAYKRTPISIDHKHLVLDDIEDVSRTRVWHNGLSPHIYVVRNQISDMTCSFGFTVIYGEYIKVNEFDLSLH